MLASPGSQVAISRNKASLRKMKRLVFPLLALAALSLCLQSADAGTTGLPPTNLRWHYYRKTCRFAEVFVRHEVELFWQKDKSITPKLLRLVYSDCFVTGCDASILLDGPNSEKTAPQNSGLGALVIIDKIKTVLESRCPGVVSCADILHLATRDALKLAGASAYPVFTGRRDGMKSNAAEVDLPLPSISWKDALAYFESRGLDGDDLATLLGGHTMGTTHCSYIVDRLYNYQGTGKPDASMNATLVNSLRKLCPPSTIKGQKDPQVYLNPGSGLDYEFTDTYYKRVLSHEAVLGVDQQLLYGDDNTTKITAEFAGNFESFRKGFALSMTRMGTIKVLTGNEGEIRRNCRYTNKGSQN